MSENSESDNGWSTQAVIDWLFSDGRLIDSDTRFVADFSERLESLIRSLDQSILFSEPFAELIDLPSKSLGAHEMEGIADAQQVYALRDK